MQSFLPFEDFRKSAESLDRMRLGKQRVETLQCLGILLKAKKGQPVKGWYNHPAVKMWEGFELSFCEYGIVVCEVWQERGYKDTVLDKIGDIIREFDRLGCEYQKPWWLGGKIHYSHRCRLVDKNPMHYGPQFPDADVNVEYYWPC